MNYIDYQFQGFRFVEWISEHTLYLAVHVPVLNLLPDKMVNK